MKRLLAIVLAGCMMFLLVACGESKQTVETSNREEKIVEDSESSTADTESSTEENVEAKAELPEEFVVSEYDKEYFQPLTNDYLIISYDLPITLVIPEWFNYLGQMAYGPADTIKESSVNVTKMAYFDGENLKGIKIRLAYASTEDAMSACTIRDYFLIPEVLGLPNKKDDSLITAEYFEDLDQQLFGTFSEDFYNGYTGNYYGHFDNFRYFEVVVPEGTPVNEETFSFWWNTTVTDYDYVNSEYIYLNTYTAGELLTVPRETLIN